MTDEEVKIVTLIVTAALGLATIARATYEYVRSARLRRFEKFQEMSRKLLQSKSFQFLMQNIDSNPAEIENMTFFEKIEIIGFYEEICIMMRSKLISKKITYYMFGYYSLRASESPEFVSGININSIYWTLFREFVEEMRKLESGWISKNKPVRIRSI